MAPTTFSSNFRMKKKIVLFLPNPVSDFRSWRGVPLSLLAISRILDRKGYEIKIVSRFLSDNPEREVIEEAKDSLCLGISAMVGFQIYDGLRVAKLIKKTCPRLPIVWGGWHPSILPRQTCEDPNVDIVVRGQGDFTFPDLVHALAEKKDLSSVQGITYKQGKRIWTNNDRGFVDINLLPSLPYHLINVEKCLESSEFGKRGIFYVSSYGCPFECGFCVEPIIYQKHWTGLAAERVVEELSFLVKKYQIDSTVLADSNFFVDKKRVYDICQGLLRKKLKIKLRHLNGKISQLINFEPEIWEVMERSGCVLLNTGAESGSQRALDLIQKMMKVEQTIKFAELCRRYHIKVQYSFMLGLPWSKNKKENERFTKEEYGQTISLIDRINKISDQNRFTYYIYLPYPGTPLFARAVNLGLKIPNSLERWSNYLLSPEDAFKTVTRQKWISPKRARLVNMLSQYIFALTDKDTYYLVEKLPPSFYKFVFKRIFALARLFAILRWKYKFFVFPIDYWVFTLLRKQGKFD